jgi:hypothetical protein
MVFPTLWVRRGQLIFPASMADLLRGGYVFLKTSECKVCGKPVRLFKTPRGRVAPFSQSRRGFYVHFAACPAAKAEHAAEKAATGQAELFPEDPF